MVEKALFAAGVAVLIVLAYAVVLFILDIYSEESQNRRSAPGDYYKDFLTDREYDEIYIEVDYIEGNAPRDGAMQHLIQQLDEVCDKNSISWHLDDSISMTREEYSHDDWQRLEDKHRDHYRDDDKGRAVMYFLYLNGRAAESGNIVGVAYHGSSVVMFKERADSAATFRITEEEIERAVLVHEAGHLLGLVNIKHTEHSGDHPDPNDPIQPSHHCGHTNRYTDDTTLIDYYDCVMYHMIESQGWDAESSWINNILGDVPNSFCEDCRRDLEELRRK